MKIAELFRTVFLISITVAVTGSVVVAVVLFSQGIDASALILGAGITFASLLITTLLACRYAITKFYFSRLREIYNTVLQLATSVTGVNTIPRKIADAQLLSEIVRVFRDLESSDKEEIVHLKELEVFRKEFLGNVSHELKTPIFTIQGYVHTLLEGGIEDQEINILYLQKAAKSIDRLISIVDDLESISRLEAGELILEHRTFDINELIEDVIESLEMKAKESSISLEYNGQAGEHNYVYADKDRIRQVIVNLLVNSIKYGKNSGHTHVKVEDHTNYIAVEVSDDGIGIEKHHLGRLFERFYRVDKSRSREQGGTGLGLAIVKHIIEAHGQKISVESTPGSGTAFTFTLKKSH